MQRLTESSNDATLIPTLEAFATANLAPTDRKPIDRAIDRLRFAAGQLPRIKAEVTAWLAAHPA